MTRRELLITGIAAAIVGVGIAINVTLVLLAVSAALVSWVSWRKPLSTIAVLLVYLPLEGFLLKFLPVSLRVPASAVPELAVWIAGLAVLFAGSYSARVRTVGAVILALAGLFTVSGAIGALVNAVEVLPAAYWIRTYVRYVPMAIVIGSLASPSGVTRWFAVPLAISVSIQALLGFAQVVGGEPFRSILAPGPLSLGGTSFAAYASVGRSIAGTLGYYNTYGMFAVMVAILSLGMLGLSATSGIARVLLRASLALAVTAVFISGSRQSLLLLALGLVVVMTAARRAKITYPVLAAASLSAATLVVLILWPGAIPVLDWIPDRFQEVADHSLFARSLQTDRLYALYTVVPAIMRSSPLLGFGPGALFGNDAITGFAGGLGLSSEAASYIQDVGWAGLLVQMGLLGTGIVLAAVGLVVVPTFRKLLGGDCEDDTMAAVVLALSAVFLVGMSVSSLLTIRSTSIVWWGVVGMGLAMIYTRSD